MNNMDVVKYFCAATDQVKKKTFVNLFSFITEFEQDAIYAPSSMNSTLLTHTCF